MIFLDSATSLDSFLKAYTTNLTKRTFEHEWFDVTEDLKNKELPPAHSFIRNLRISNHLVEDYSIFENVAKSGLSTKQAIAKLTRDNLPPSRAENYVHLQIVWENNWIQSFAGSFKLYNIKHVAPTLEALQKMIESYHSRRIDMLKIRCDFHTLANISSHRSTDSSFCHFRETKKKYLREHEKIWLVDLP